jgi:cytochrome c biogenesis protein CcmG, thiol:disulfide interchange protein DsbE
MHPGEIMKRILILLALVMFVSLTACSRKEPETAQKSAGPVVQKQAPDITVTALNGSTLKLSDLKGKVVMLNFWATWCPPCREEIPSLMKLNAAMAGKPFQMLAVSVDEGGKPAIEDFFRTSKTELPAYTDQDGNASKTYGITGVPETFLIDKKGVIVKKVIGPLAWDGPEAIAFLEGLVK